MRLRPTVTMTLGNSKPTPVTADQVGFILPPADEIIKIVNETSVNAAKIAGVLYIGHKLLSTACEIAIIAAKARF